MRESNRDRNSNAIIAGRNYNLAVDEVKRHIVILCLYFMIFYNINRVCNNCQLISISDLPSSEKQN